MVEINNKTKSRINLCLVKKIAEEFLKTYKKTDQSVSLVFVGDKTIRRLNRVYRGKDEITDILSFEGEDDFFGEVIIDYSQIKRQAVRFKHSVRRELIFILVHGLLHLSGYSHETDDKRKKMIKTGEKFINNLGLK